MPAHSSVLDLRLVGEPPLTSPRQPTLDMTSVVPNSCADSEHKNRDFRSSYVEGSGVGLRREHSLTTSSEHQREALNIFEDFWNVEYQRSDGFTSGPDSRVPYEHVSSLAEPWTLFGSQSATDSVYDTTISVDWLNMDRFDQTGGPHPTSTDLPASGHLNVDERVRHRTRSPYSSDSVISRRAISARRATGSLHQCSQCDKSFSRASDLNKHHKRRHLGMGERGYKCDSCKMSFIYPKDLSRHKKTHTDTAAEIFCPVPDCRRHHKGFTRSDHRARHLRAVHAFVDASPQPRGDGVIYDTEMLSLQDQASSIKQ